MGRYIVALLHLFTGRLPDTESHAKVVELAANPNQWSAGHAVFDEVRHRLLAATKTKDQERQRQYGFEEYCCKAMYNATLPRDEFDASSAFFVVPEALMLGEWLVFPSMQFWTRLCTRIRRQKDELCSHGRSKLAHGSCWRMRAVLSSAPSQAGFACCHPQRNTKSSPEMGWEGVSTSGTPKSDNRIPIVYLSSYGETSRFADDLADALMIVTAFPRYWAMSSRAAHKSDGAGRARHPPP